MIFWHEYIPNPIWWGVGITIAGLGLSGSAVLFMWLITVNRPEPGEGYEE